VQSIFPTQFQLLLETTKAAYKLTDKEPVRNKLQETAKATVLATSKLLESAKAASKSNKPEVQQQISAISSDVMERINDYVNAVRELPGAQKLALVEEFGEDLDEVAEKELRNAAKIIELAAASLMKPREENVELNWAEITVEDAIIEAARAIALATGTLVKAAAASQRERVAAQKDIKTKHLYKKDPTWANGLISAAQAVSATTQQLVIIANNAAQHKEGGDDNHLVAAARSVAASTAQLVAASKAKADPMSQTQKTLSDAAKSVAKATSELVNASKAVAKREEEEKQRKLSVTQQTKLQQSKIAEIEMQAKILKLEKKLASARQDLIQSRKNEYAQK